MRVKISKTLIILITLFLFSFAGVVYCFNSLVGELSRVVLLISSLLLAFDISIRNVVKSLLKFNQKSYKSLYDWSNDLQGGHLLINKLISDIQVETDILKNLTKIKNEILIYSKHDIENLRLLNAYFTIIKEEKEKEVYFKIVMSFVAGAVILFLRNPQNASIYIVNLINIFSPFELLLSFIIFLAFFINVTYLGNKRVRLIQAIIEECIEDLK